MTRNGSDRARFGPFEVNLHTHELWKFGTRLKLVGQPFEILSVLLSRSGELVTREELRTRLWPADTFVDFNHGLNAAVNKLREALSDSAETPRYVETLPRRGYRFIATVEWVAATPALAARANLNPPTTIREDFPLLPQASEVHEDWHDDNEGSGSSRWPQFVIGSGVLVAMLLMGTFLLKTVSGYSARFVNRSSPQRIRPLNSVGIEPAFSPDGNSVAFVRDGGKPGEAGVFVMPVGSDQPTQLTHNDRDCCPVWSPDGRSIAFSRFANKEISIYVVSADGGAEQKRAAEKAPNPTSAAFTVSAAGFTERKLNTSGVVPQHGEIEWASDGKSIVFSGASGLYLLSLDNSSLHRLTEPPAMAEDWGPTFSPDGEKLLFVRNHQVGLPDEIWYASATGGSATRILSEPGRIVSSPQWSYDGRAVIYSSNRNGHPALWRASIDTPDSAVQMKEAGSPAWDPAVSRRGYRMAYERIIRSLSIWQLDLSSARHEPPRLLVASTSDTDQGPGPQFSPDGKKLAYMSDRSGTMEIWVSNRDGSNPFQLTAVGVAGTPRWSPDSQSIVFDTNSPNGPEILSINLRGGAPQVLTQDKYENQVPSWSHDGKWIYFASDRTGAREVWKIPASGGEPVQLTHHGGHAALESLDGRVVYYAKTFLPDPEIWQIPVGGGPETPLPLVRPGTWASWQVVENGILFVGPSLGHQAVLSFYDFAHQRTTTVSVLNRIPFWLGATTDGRTVAFDQPGQEQSQAMLVDNFR
jgi:Tol biopolymer transport system component/DNA-binding winged helix-turn-helix (wHTH) protein